MLKRIGLVSVLAIVVSALALAPVTAQDNSGSGDQMMSAHVCDSTVITLLFIAESQYGFHSMMDVTQFDKGQFQPWFDAMMSAMDSGSMMESTPEAAMGGSDSSMMESTPEAMMGSSDMAMTHLESGAVANEDPACAQLRTELESFFTNTFNSEYMVDTGM